MAGRDDLVEALVRMGRGAIEKVDLGDMTRLDVPERLAALSKMVSKPAKKADDWGWKGGKPGEVTGSELTSLSNRRDVGRYREAVHGEKYKYAKEDKQALEEATKKAVKQVNALRKKDPEHPLVRSYDLYKNTYGASPRQAALQATVQHFQELERFGVPRRWTGKTVKAIDQTRRAGNAGIGFSPQNVAKAMEPMSDPQREMFLRILPSAKYETIEKTADIARGLGGLTARQAEDFFAMLPTFQGRLDKLLGTVRRLRPGT